ncbi:MAG: hypothetical protein RI575_15480 [Balneolaceae bacterium]|nr:hypothetical protein [Balneolaceae bacterium]MDR9410603.1 hypothetical protein [Balneolaceae bacterium]
MGHQAHKEAQRTEVSQAIPLFTGQLQNILYILNPDEQARNYSTKKENIFPYPKKLCKLR